MMEGARTSETLVNFYLATRRYNPEDSHLHRSNSFGKYVYSVMELFKEYVKGFEISRIQMEPVLFSLALRIARLGNRVDKNFSYVL
jgi:hypothetical protein